MSLKEGFAIWLTGLPSSGKTTLALSLASLLRQESLPVEVLDGDEIRLGLSADLGYSADDRKEHARRVTWLSKILVRNGILVIIPLISPYRDTREIARRELGKFVEVYVKCSLQECVRRDVKGLYAKAIKGEIKEFTGISDPYEEPESPSVTVETDSLTESQCQQRIIEAIVNLGYLDAVGSDKVPARDG